MQVSSNDKCLCIVFIYWHFNIDIEAIEARSYATLYFYKSIHVSKMWFVKCIDKKYTMNLCNYVLYNSFEFNYILPWMKKKHWNVYAICVYIKPHKITFHVKVHTNNEISLITTRWKCKFYKIFFLFSFLKTAASK